MTFPTVKSDPWKKGKKPKKRFDLWPDSLWTKLCANERGLAGTGDLSGCSILLIVQMLRGS